MITGHEFGAESDGGYLLEARAQISRRLSDRIRLAVDYYGDFNHTEAIGSFDEQEHQLGPLLKWNLRERFTANLGILFGVSDAAADREFRLFLTQAF